MKFKEIQLFPSVWKVDVIVVDDATTPEDVVKFARKRYGIPEHLIDTDTIVDSVTSLTSSADSQLKGHKRILMVLRDLNDHATLVHELIHVMWHASEFIGLNMNPDSQEWQALFMEYLFTETLKSNYKTIKTNKQKKK